MTFISQLLLGRDHYWKVDVVISSHDILLDDSNNFMDFAGTPWELVVIDGGVTQDVSCLIRSKTMKGNAIDIEHTLLITDTLPQNLMSLLKYIHPNDFKFFRNEDNDFEIGLLEDYNLHSMVERTGEQIQAEAKRSMNTRDMDGTIAAAPRKRQRTNKKQDHTSHSLSLPFIIDQLGGVAINVFSFLTPEAGPDLHVVCHAWHQLLVENENALFGSYLQNHFEEGAVLCYVASQRNLSCKKLYLAFLKRWEFCMEDHNSAITVDWRGDYVDLFPNATLPENINDATSLVFFARHGEKDPTGCALLEFNREYDDTKSSLCIDNKWSNATGGLLAEQFSHQQFNRQDPTLAFTGPITLHVLDTRFYSVATMMECHAMAIPNQFTGKRHEIQVNNLDRRTVELPGLGKFCPR